MLNKNYYQTGAGFQVLVFSISFLIVVSRRPDTLLNPQFWAEDGAIWYSEAYNNSFFTTLITPVAGYFQTVSRLVAGLAQFLPFSAAPLFFNFIAITCKVLVVNFLISERFYKIIPNKLSRIFLAFIYLAIPNSYEVHANLTNVQWHLALLTCIVILATPNRRLRWQIFDIVVILLSSLSGPLCLFLLPIAVIRYIQTKQRWTLFLSGIVLLGVMMQTYSLAILTGLIFNRTENVGLGATFELFLKICGGQVFLASIIGQNQYIEIVNRNYWTFIPALTVTLVGFVVIGYSFWRGTSELKLFLLFAGLIFTGSLISPVVTATQPQWEVLWQPAVGSRYWFIPMMGFILSLIFIISRTEKWHFRVCGVLFLLCLLSGIIKDWKFPPFDNLHFQEEAKKLTETPSGEQIEIPINPKGWTMKIIKK